MKAIRIDPQTRALTLEALPPHIRAFATEFAEPRQIGRLPNGDLLWAGTDRINRAAFSLGSSKQVVGCGLLVGKKGDSGDYTDARTDIETVRKLVQFSELPPFEVETTPDTVTPAIEEFAAELRCLAPVYVPVVPAPGSRAGRCWESVATAMRKHGGHRRYGWAIWERPGLFLTAEFHAVWETNDGELVDPTPKADAEERIAFCAASSLAYNETFNFLKRPANRRSRLYRVVPDIAATIERMRPAKKAYESRVAAKHGLSLEQWVSSKVPLDDLETAIERLFSICTEVDALIEVGLEGMTSKYPDKVRTLETEKMRVHQRILDLAREKLGSGAVPDPAAVPKL